MKIKDRGYWISTLYKYQSLWYWFWYSVYFRSITFFSSANPGLHLGGMLDDKKSDIYKLVNPQYLPITIELQNPVDTFLNQMEHAGLSFPVMVKPDIGFKGFLVKKIDTSDEMKSVISEFGHRDILIQEYIGDTREFSVMCYFIKNTGRYKVSSFVEKHLPFVTGDGHKSLSQLINELKSPFLKKDWITRKMAQRGCDVPAAGERIIIDHVGNYARGSKFESLNDQIDDALEQVINRFFENMEGLNFGRLDIKSKSVEALKMGEFKLLEINGAKSEPIHIYDPKVGWWEAIKDISFHWRTLFDIVKENRYYTKDPSSSEGLKSYWSLKKSVGL